MALIFVGIILLVLCCCKAMKRKDEEDDSLRFEEMGGTPKAKTKKYDINGSIRNSTQEGGDTAKGIHQSSEQQPT